MPAIVIGFFCMKKDISKYSCFNSLHVYSVCLMLMCVSFITPLFCIYECIILIYEQYNSHVM
jgi:hypothetical protein